MVRLCSKGGEAHPKRIHCASHRYCSLCRLLSPASDMMHIAACYLQCGAMMIVMDETIYAHFISKSVIDGSKHHSSYLSSLSKQSLLLCSAMLIYAADEAVMLASGGFYIPLGCAWHLPA